MKLSETDKKEILRLHDGGWTNPQIAARFDVTAMSVAYTLDPGLYNERDRRRRAEIRRLVFEHYGTACKCCGATDDLTIDHVNGDGKEHRARHEYSYFYGWLVSNKFPDDPPLQTLCMTCNQSKHRGPACQLHTWGFPAHLSERQLKDMLIEERIATADAVTAITEKIDAASAEVKAMRELLHLIMAERTY
jgi:hypothetical protein